MENSIQQEKYDRLTAILYQQYEHEPINVEEFGYEGIVFKPSSFGYMWSTTLDEICKEFQNHMLCQEGLAIN